MDSNRKSQPYLQTRLTLKPENIKTLLSFNLANTYPNLQQLHLQLNLIQQLAQMIASVQYSTTLKSITLNKKGVENFRKKIIEILMRNDIWNKLEEFQLQCWDMAYIGAGDQYSLKPVFERLSTNIKSLKIFCNNLTPDQLQHQYLPKQQNISLKLQNLKTLKLMGAKLSIISIKQIPKLYMPILQNICIGCTARKYCFGDQGVRYMGKGYWKYMKILQMGITGGNFDGFVYGLALLCTNNNSVVNNNINNHNNTQTNTNICIYKVDTFNNKYYGFISPITALNLAAITYSNKIRIQSYVMNQKMRDMLFQSVQVQYNMMEIVD